MASHQERILSIKETAEFFGRCQNTIRNWADPLSKHHIPDFPAKYRFGDRPGSRVGFKLSEILTFVERCRQTEAQTNE